MKVQRPTPTSGGGGSPVTVSYRTPESRGTVPVEPEVLGTKSLTRSEELGMPRYCRCGARAVVVETDRYPHRYSCAEHVGRRRGGNRMSQLEQLMELIQEGATD